MIEKSVRIHDKFSLELKSGYSTRRKIKEKLFEVNTWVSILNILDINRQPYDKSGFYKVLKPNIRLITPDFFSRDIADRTMPDNLPTADSSQKLYRVPVIASDTSHSLAEMSGLYSLAGSLERTG